MKKYYKVEWLEQDALTLQYYKKNKIIPFDWGNILVDKEERSRKEANEFVKELLLRKMPNVKIKLTLCEELEIHKYQWGEGIEEYIEKRVYINDLIDKWEKETAFQADMGISGEDACYKRIIEMGIEVVPHILERINREYSWIIAVLWKVIPEEEQPKIPDEYRNNLRGLTDMWINWGIKNKYLLDPNKKTETID
jgi:hypothetical protein